MINPADIQIDELPSVALDEKAKLPETPSIYFAVDSQGVVQYIGQSVNPQQRWKQHHRQYQLDSCESVRIAYLDCPKDLLDEVESALINHFCPVLNGARLYAEEEKTSNDTKPLSYWKSPIGSCIVWRLPELMQRHKIKGKDLALAMSVSQNTVSNLKKATMPRLDVGSLDKLMSAINGLTDADAPLITVGDLILWVPDELEGGKRD